MGSGAYYGCVVYVSEKILVCYKVQYMRTSELLLKNITSQRFVSM